MAPVSNTGMRARSHLRSSVRGGVRAGAVTTAAAQGTACPVLGLEAFFLGTKAKSRTSIPGREGPIWMTAEMPGLSQGPAFLLASCRYSCRPGCPSSASAAQCPCLVGCGVLSGHLTDQQTSPPGAPLLVPQGSCHFLGSEFHDTHGGLAEANPKLTVSPLMGPRAGTDTHGPSACASACLRPCTQGDAWFQVQVKDREVRQGDDGGRLLP